MASLLYVAITSLDGYMEDVDGRLDWSTPEEEFQHFIIELMRPWGVYLYGRRMYEAMALWEDPAFVAEQPAYMAEFAASWQAAGKVVYSRTLQQVWTARTRLERELAAEGLRQIKEQASRDMTIGGPDLAGQAIRAGLVDDYHLFIVPIVLGGGKPWLPRGVRLPLELLDQHRFPRGMVYLHYRPRP
jgi:dihydrofolate reductase